jgi:hypothetical protein
MPPQPAQEREPSRRRTWHKGPGDADCRWKLFSMYCRPVGQVIFANWLATTFAMSGKSPIHSLRRLIPACRKASIASPSWPISELSEDILSRAPRDALRSGPRRCCGRADCQFGWWRGTRNLLRQNSFWLRRLDLNQRVPAVSKAPAREAGVLSRHAFRVKRFDQFLTH